MCRLWGRIRYGVRWDPVDQAQLALKSFSLKDVTAVGDREFWHRLTLPQVRATNPKMQVKVKMLSDGCRPQFVANLHDGRQVVFKTDGFQLPDLLMRLNRLLGLPARQNGPRQSDPDPLRGEPDEALQQRIPEAQMEAHFRALAKKRKPIDFLS
ncbi:hypothetical protein niasHS_015626 [Heterodera schachtii]|uniref:Ribosomal protein/NADH dehydrogenase domain-containing protein n=1 Tax=Heterodera schachtii TaxID=97005 RepID=A0ABD2HSW0_HETSC